MGRYATLSLGVGCASKLVRFPEHAIVRNVGNLAEKGNVSINVSQELLDEALQSVDKYSTKGVSSASPSHVAASDMSFLRGELDKALAQARELSDKLKQEHDMAVRIAADFENYKKKIAKEREENARFGCEKLARDLLPVVDNLHRALAHADVSKDFPSFELGVKMTRKLLDETLSRHGIKSFPSVGQKFNPQVHEAMMQQESTQAASNTVLEEMAMGFSFHDRLLRPAMVVIAKTPSDSSPTDKKEP